VLEEFTLSMLRVDNSIAGSVGLVSKIVWFLLFLLCLLVIHPF